MNVKEKLKSAHGEGAITDEALEEMRDRIVAGMSFHKYWLLLRTTTQRVSTLSVGRT